MSVEATFWESHFDNIFDGVVAALIATFVSSAYLARKSATAQKGQPVFAQLWHGLRYSSDVLRFVAFASIVFVLAGLLAIATVVPYMQAPGILYPIAYRPAAFIAYTIVFMTLASVGIGRLILSVGLDTRKIAVLLLQIAALLVISIFASSLVANVAGPMDYSNFTVPQIAAMEAKLERVAATGCSVVWFFVVVLGVELIYRSWISFNGLGRL